MHEKARARIGCVAAAAALAVASGARDARAAGEVGFGAAYDARLPLFGFRDFVSDPAWGGFQSSLDFFFNDVFSAGIAGQYSLFRQDSPSQTTAIPNGAITSEAFKYAHVWSVYPIVRAYLAPHAALRPYVALGVGPMNVSHTILASDLVVSEEKWFLMVQPSAGLYYRLGPSFRYGLRDDPGYGVVASVSYAITTARIADANDISYLGFELGLYSKY